MLNQKNDSNSPDLFALPSENWLFFLIGEEPHLPCYPTHKEFDYMCDKYLKEKLNF